MTDFSTILYEKKGHIAYITLNRPERLNAFDSVMREELPTAWKDFDEDENIWVAVLTGAGSRAFCVGADVKDMAGGVSDNRWQRLRQDVRSMHFTTRHIDIWKPVICAVNGMCCGGGLHFVGDSDIVICSEQATFFDTHVDVGQVSAWEPIGLSRRIPLGYAIRMALLGGNERMSAQKALEIGLVTEVVPAPQLLARATEIAEIIAEKAPLAVQGTIEAIWRGLNVGLKDAWAQGHFILTRNWMTEDFKEGPRAFAEKRKPKWKAK